MNSRSDAPEYQCPGEPATISRAVHLARLADGYPGCRECPHREDTGGLSERLKQRIPPARPPGSVEDFFDDEGAVGSLHEGFDANLAGRIAAAFGIALREQSQSPGRTPTVVVAGDGRSVTQPHFAAAVERLRWAGCDVVELGAVPCPALSWTVAELDTDGGLYTGNPLSDPHKAGIRFIKWAGRPVAGSKALARIHRGVETEPVRPVRTCGKASRTDALARYEAAFADSYHGLRPLRFLLHTTCRPAGRCVERLLQNTACKLVLRESDTGMPPERISESVGHFAVAIEDDGRRCRLWDERGEPVAFEGLFSLLAQSVCAEPAGRAVVVSEGAPETLTPMLERLTLKVQRCGPLPSEVHAAMVDGGAAVGADRSGRVWYGEAGGWIIADALATLTLLLGILSDDDRPLSEVLDAGTAGH